MADEADRVGDIATALRLIKVGDDRPLSIEEINDLLDQADPMELWRGYATLLHSWLMGCTQPEVVTAVIDRLRRFGLFPEETLTTIGQGLAAAIRGEPSATWRREHDTISRVELAGWLYAAWLVSDLIDSSQGKGTVAEATIGALMELAEQANEGKRHCSFCGAHQDHVQVLIACPGVYICDRCVPIQLPRSLSDEMQGDERRCSFCGHPDWPMAVGASARICEVCLHLCRDMLRERRQRGTAEGPG